MQSKCNLALLKQIVNWKIKDLKELTHVIEAERERDRERERERKRQTDRKTETDRDTERQRES
jgi:hypothetical protein